MRERKIVVLYVLRRTLAWNKPCFLCVSAARTPRLDLHGTSPVSCASARRGRRDSTCMEQALFPVRQRGADAATRLLAATGDVVLAQEGVQVVVGAAALQNEVRTEQALVNEPQLLQHFP